MPVILSHEEVNIWMNPKNTKDIQSIINKSLLNKDKQVWKNIGFAKIAPYVNKLNDKSVKCLMTVDEYKKQLDRTGLMRFWKKAPAVEAVNTSGQVIKQGISAQQSPKAPDKFDPCEEKQKEVAEMNPLKTEQKKY